MEALSASVTLTPSTVAAYYSKKFPAKPRLSLFKFLPSKFISTSFSVTQKKKGGPNVSASPLASLSSTAAATSTSSPLTASTTAGRDHWMVLMEGPPEGIDSSAEIINYYVRTLGIVLGNEKDAQMCIYDASCVSPFGFCCDIGEEASRELARLPGVLLVRPDKDYRLENKDYSFSALESNETSDTQIRNLPLFLAGSTRHWLVRMDRPGIGVVTKAQMVDYYVQILTKVLGNEKDAQMCIYHVSWQSNFGFCCELDDECAEELAGVPGVLSVELDKNFESGNKVYGGNKLEDSTSLTGSSEVTETTPIRTKKLFVTGLSFYTSEKTLRAAFEGFGELLEVKIIMDKISKRSKGYAFVEYTTEEAAGAALKEMDGKIINGWMIVVDVAKPRTPKFGWDRPRPAIR